MEAQKQRPRRGAMTEAAAAAPPGGPWGRRGGRPLAARRGGAALRRRSRSRRRRCCPSSPCPRRSPARSLAPFSLRFRLKGGREKELGRHFPSAAATAATARRTGGRTEHRSKADSSRRGGAGGGRSALPGLEETFGGGGRGAGSGCRRWRLFVRGGGGRLHPLPPPARPPGRAAVPGRAQAPPEPRKAGEGALKRRKSSRSSPPPPSPPPPPRPPARKVRAAPGAGGEERGARAAAAAARPRPPPALGAQAGGCLQTAPILWGRIRPGYAPPSRGRCCCCCSFPPPPPAALSPSPRSPCGSHFSLSLLVVTRKAGQGRKNPRNFKWPLRASPLRVRGWESPQGRGCAGALSHQLPPRSPAFPLAFYLKMRP